MKLTHQVYHSIDDVDPDEWDACIDVEREIFARREFVRAVERSMSDSEYLHVVFRDEQSRPVTTATLCIYHIDGSLLAEGSALKIARFLERVNRSLIHVPIAICGLPVSAGQSNLRIRTDLDVDVAAVLQQLDIQMTSWARQHRARAIVFKEFNDAECSRIKAIESLGYRKADSLPMNCTQPGFETFEDYLASVKSRRRSPIRRAIKKFEKTGLRIVQRRGGEGVAELFTDDVHKLYLAVLDRAEVKFERLPAEFFREIARELPNNSWFTFVVDDRERSDDPPTSDTSTDTIEASDIIAFATSVHSPASFHQMFVGVRYDRKEESDLYFNLFFHAIDVAFRQQTEEIRVGQSANEFKRQKFSCWQEPLSFFVKPLHPVAKLVFRLAFKSFFPSYPARLKEKTE
jgi:predicted N-acyltransferase